MIHNLISSVPYIFKFLECKTTRKFHGLLDHPNFRFLLLCHGEVKKIEGNEELGGMSLALFLDPLSINLPCSLLAQVLVTVRNAR